MKRVALVMAVVITLISGCSAADTQADAVQQTVSTNETQAVVDETPPTTAVETTTTALETTTTAPDPADAASAELRQAGDLMDRGVEFIEIGKSWATGAMAITQADAEELRTEANSIADEWERLIRNGSGEWRDFYEAEREAYSLFATYWHKYGQYLETNEDAYISEANEAGSKAIERLEEANTLLAEAADR